MLTLYRIADGVRQSEYQSALALGHSRLDALNMSWAAYNAVMLS